MLKKIKFENFKSLPSYPISLSDFNVLIGANGSGKSNFVDGMKFLKDILNQGLASAVGSRLGWLNTLTRGLTRKDTLAIETFYDFSKDPIDFRPSPKRSFKLNDARHFAEFAYSGRRYYIKLEDFKSNSTFRDKEYKEEYYRALSRVKINSQVSPQQRHAYVPSYYSGDLYLEQSFWSITSNVIADQIDDWRFYHLDVQAARKACVDTGEDVLEADGCNLALILDKMSKSQSRPIRVTHDRILNTMSLLVPQFNKWRTDQQIDGSTTFSIYESGIEKALLPGMISDGSIRLLSILTTLLYQPDLSSIICIDEPERYLHPQVLGPLVEIMREVSKKTQIIITTHSSELVKLLKPYEVLLVDKIDNVTQIINAQSIEMIDQFLEEFSLDELWLKGYLRRGKAI